MKVELFLVKAASADLPDDVSVVLGHIMSFFHGQAIFDVSTPDGPITSKWGAALTDTQDQLVRLQEFANFWYAIGILEGKGIIKVHDNVKDGK